MNLSLQLCLIVFLAILVVCPNVDAAPKSVTARNNVIEVFERVPPPSGFEFHGWLNNSGKQTLVLGEKLQLNFKASESVYVYIAYLDTDAVVTLFEPEFGPGGNLLHKNIDMSFPPPNSNLEITVEPPIGAGTMLSIAVIKPLPENLIADLNSMESEGRRKYGDRYSVKLAEQFLAALLEHNRADEIAISVYAHEIVQRQDGAQYAVQDIVNYFSKRGSRSIINPSLDADINFRPGSHELTSSARLNLDMWGESLMHPYLVNATFKIGGHTDDVGTSEANLSLSKHRAEAVVEYITSKFGIADSRLTIHPFGESTPKIEGTDDRARAANRRVEFLQLTN